VFGICSVLLPTHGVIKHDDDDVESQDIVFTVQTDGRTYTTQRQNESHYSDEYGPVKREFSSAQTGCRHDDVGRCEMRDSATRRHQPSWSSTHTNTHHHRDILNCMSAGTCYLINLRNLKCLTSAVMEI